jgi:hypothetical protein
VLNQEYENLEASVVSVLSITPEQLDKSFFPKTDRNSPRLPSHWPSANPSAVANKVCVDIGVVWIDAKLLTVGFSGNQIFFHTRKQIETDLRELSGLPLFQPVDREVRLL